MSHLFWLAERLSSPVLALRCLNIWARDVEVDFVCVGPCKTLAKKLGLQLFERRGPEDWDVSNIDSSITYT